MALSHTLRVARELAEDAEGEDDEERLPRWAGMGVAGQWSGGHNRVVAASELIPCLAHDGWLSVHCSPLPSLLLLLLLLPFLTPASPCSLPQVRQRRCMG